MFSFLREGWVIGWLGFVISVVTAIQTVRRARLEREKLELEIKKLRNSPEVVKDRREIYERLRGVLRDVTRDVNPTLEQIGELHSIRHDGEFRFSEEISEGLRVLIGHVVGLHVSRQVMDAKRNRVPDIEWNAIVEKDHVALQGVLQYEAQLIETFKPYLLL